MSYRGRPSKGCESCRSRKVKCDENKPSCNRCSKAGLDCRYRDQGDLLFRNQTAFAAQKAEDSWRKRAKSNQRQPSGERSTNRRSPQTKSLSPPLNSDQQPSPSNSQESPQSETTSDTSNALTGFNDLTIAPEIQPDLRRLAYERLLYDFVILENPNLPPGETPDDLWNFVPLLYDRSQEGSCFKTIVTAVSYANYSSRCNAPFAQALAEDFLGKGIKLLQKSIADKRLAATDDVLGSVYLMGVYENLSTPRRDGNFVAHKEGANALLQLREIDEFYTNPISSRLYEILFAQMLIGNLLSCKPPTVPIRNVIAARQHLPALFSSQGIYVIQLIHNEATLHAKWSDLKSSPNPPTTREELHDLLQVAILLEAEFDTWESTVPPTWRYDIWQNTPEFRSNYPSRWANIILGSEGAPPEIHGYSTLKRCWHWMFYRTARMYLLRDLLEMLNWALRMPEPAPTTTPPSMGDSQPATPLDTLSLQIQHSFATCQMVKVIERCSAAVLCHWTVPIYGKVPEDVPGMRGYTTLWCLAVMDSALRMGLVPDSASNPPESAAYHDPLIDPRLTQPSTSSSNPFLNPQLAQHQTSGSSPFIDPHIAQHATPNSNAFFGLPTSADDFAAPSGSTAFDSQNMDFSTTPTHPHFPPAGINPTDGIPHLDPIAPPPNPFLRSYPALDIAPPLASPEHSHPTGQKHAFDQVPSHEWDAPPDLAPLTFGEAAAHVIDVEARRGWINRVMYYMATELGIKKGLAIVVLEGYLEKSKAEVESYLAQSS